MAGNIVGEPMCLSFPRDGGRCDRAAMQCTSSSPARAMAATRAAACGCSSRSWLPRWAPSQRDKVNKVLQHGPRAWHKHVFAFKT
eukprot:2878601-Prymnesium_polylepis.1